MYWKSITNTLNSIQCHKERTTENTKKKKIDLQSGNKVFVLTPHDKARRQKLGTLKTSAKVIQINEHKQIEIRLSNEKHTEYTFQSGFRKNYIILYINAQSKT